MKSADKKQFFKARKIPSGLSLKIQNRFLKSFGWLMAAQISGRLARLLSTLVIARLMSPELFGIAALALTVNEMSSVVARFGTSSALVQCGDNQLEKNCETAWGLNWIIGISLFLLQCLIAIPIASWYQSPDLILPICVLALSYLLLPLASVNAALTIRRSAMRTVAKAEVLQAITDTLLTVTLAILGFGVWALILPKVLVIPIWIYTHRTASPWQSAGFTLETYKPLLRFSKRVISTELLAVIRHNIDYILIGAFLGTEALGIYFFAFNAGLGITRGITAALSGALYPYLCQSSGSLDTINKRFKKGITLYCSVITFWVFLQTTFASHYVPVIFGQRWVDYGAVPILILICFAAIPMAITDACAQYLRARGLPQNDLRWQLPFTCLFAAGLLVGLQWNITGVAIAVLTINIINIPFYLFYVVVPALRSEHTLDSKLGKENIQYA